MAQIEEQAAAVEQYGRLRDQAELHAERAVQIALYAKLQEYELEWGGVTPAAVLAPGVDFDSNLHIWIAALALAAWYAAHSRDKGPAPTSLDAYRVKNAWTEMVVAEKAGFIDKLAQARVERIINEFPKKPEDRANLGSNTGWARSVARTEATRVASEALSEMNVLALGAELGRPLTERDEAEIWKIWITRGDAKVRELHRKLQGAPVRGVETPFWSWPTGQTLRWPGDPLAPYGTIVNCRCIHWVMPGRTPEADIGDTFRPANLDSAFDTPMVSGAHSHLHPSVYPHGGTEIGDASFEYDVVMRSIRAGVVELQRD